VGFDHLYGEIAAFGVLSAGLLLGFRQKLKSAIKGRQEFDDEQAFVLDVALPAGGEAKVQYQGTSWPAVNAGGEALTAGTRVKIARKDGIKIFVTKA
jgi:membrane protein implicated in regulation of membrane protease activity